MSEDLNPYQPPSAASLTPTAQPRNRLAGCAQGSLGCGCFIPFVLFLITGISGTIDSPPLWPLLVIFGTIVGAVIGTVCAPVKKQ